MREVRFAVATLPCPLFSGFPGAGKRVLSRALDSVVPLGGLRGRSPTAGQFCMLLESRAHSPKLPVVLGARRFLY